MSKESDQPDQQPEGTARKNRAKTDVLLFALAHLVEQDQPGEGPGTSIGITLVTAGGTLSGNLVSTGAYLDSLKSTARRGSEWLASFIEGLVDGLEESPEFEDKPYTHLHLTDVRMVSGDSVSLKVGEIRVRLDDVVGWSLGAFGRSDDA